MYSDHNIIAYFDIDALKIVIYHVAIHDIFMLVQRSYGCDHHTR